jgi:hypothetical protein
MPNTLTVHKVEVAGLDRSEYPIFEYSCYIIGVERRRQWIADEAVDAVRTMALNEMEVSDFLRIHRWIVVSVDSVDVRSV